MSQILADALRAHVHELSAKIGERHPGRPQALAAARDYVCRVLAAYGWDTTVLPYGPEGLALANVEAVLPGAEGPGAARLVVGAHYDTVPGTPGADDNASGVAALLELARLLRGSSPRKSLALAAFSTEEAPYFGGPLMGSAAYARRCRERGDRIEGMLSLEMVGYYSPRRGAQTYPPLLKYFFPKTADFVALVGNPASRAFLRRVRDALKPRLAIPLEHACLPAWVRGVGLSDQRSFWTEGWPGVMLTDTAFYRNPHYHGPRDAAETLDYGSMAAVVSGLAEALKDLAS